MTYLQILNLIKDTALAQPNVNSVVREFLDLNREDAKYSAVVIQDRDGSRDRIVEQDYVTYTWHLGYVDRLTYDESNRDDIISTGINIINNIVNTIRNTWFPELEVSIVDRINTFDQRFTAQCAGVYVVLAVNAQVSDCVDSESTDLYDTYDAKITANGVYHFVPSGRPVDEINITVDVAGLKKEEVSLTDTVTMNGTHSYIPEEDTVYKDVELTVDVHPTERLVQTYTTNGVKTITGEFNGGEITVDVDTDTVWGHITGNITDQTDLVDYVTGKDNEIKTWVESQSYLTSSSLNGYATESWVTSQGYLTEHQDLSDYAQKSEIEPLYNKSEGYLKYVPGITHLEGMSNAGYDIFGYIENNYRANNLVNRIHNKIYAYNPYENRFLRFNEETFSFDEYRLNYNGEMPTQVYPMWNDSQGRIYYGNKFMLNIDDDNKTVEMFSQDLGGDYQQNNSTIKNNIIEKDGVVYMISRRNACAYIFNEETQSFDSSIPVQGRFPSSIFYKYLTEFEGHWIYDMGQEQTELVFHFEAEPYAEWVVLPERLFPGAWSYEYEGQTINETTRGVYVHPVVKSGGIEYYTFGNANPVMYKLVNGSWEIVGYNQTVPNMLTNECGCACGTLWFGFGYLNDMPNHLIIWNMDDSAAGKPEFYGWYDLDSEIGVIRGNVEGLLNSENGIYNDINRINGDISNLDSRISALETNYGDALNITNQILG